MSETINNIDNNEVDQTVDLTQVRPYGDTINDGKTQLSFTLPVPAGDEASEAAKQLMRQSSSSISQRIGRRLHLLCLLW